MILAGGYDLDAEIDRPLFHLVGHSSPICKVTAIAALDRCISVDTLGEVRYWDVNKGKRPWKWLCNYVFTMCYVYYATKYHLTT